MSRHRVALNRLFWRCVESWPGRVALALIALAWCVVVVLFMVALALSNGPN